MKNSDRLASLCVEGLKRLNIFDSKHKDRLKLEIRSICVQDEEEYVLKLYDDKAKGLANVNNLLVWYILGICDDFDINKEPEYSYGDYPDIDVDYLPQVGTYLKREFIPKTFGEEYVCDIGSYNTFGAKSTILDLARIFGIDRAEVLKITKTLKLKDDDGAYSWDEIIENDEELKAFLKKHPDLADAARRLTGRRKSMGKHAAGVIVSSKPLSSFVPLVRSKDGTPCSAWVEGQSDQELSRVGLVKFDVLRVAALEKIDLACRLIRQRYPEIKGICALPGDDDWSDDFYLNDPKCIEMANAGKLKGVFQFDSNGIREMVKKGGVEAFDDLVAYTALYRPSCLSMGMDEEYIQRKKGKKTDYDRYELLEPFLGSTYFVMIYQEQIMQILKLAGKIPEKNCYEVIKAISKKKLEKFIKYKEMFIDNAQQTLSITKEKAEKFWQEIESFAGYGFNLAHACSYTLLSARMLYLKAYYPLELFTAELSFLKVGDEKICEYKKDALANGISVEKVDLNKSKENFSIVGDKIYYGFSNLKGIGLPVAKKIVENQPYEDFDDFLKKYGTDTKVVVPLIALGAFEGNKMDLYVKYEQYKDQIKKLKTKSDRCRKNIANCEIEMDALLCGLNLSVDQVDDINDIDPYKYKQYYKLLEMKYRNEQRLDGYSIDYNFDYLPKPKINMETKRLLTDIMFAETEFYGFLWTTDLIHCLDYGGRTLGSAIEDGHTMGSIEVQIIKVVKKISKQGNAYYNVEVHDSIETQNIFVWQAEYDKFKNILVAGNCVRMQVALPTENFSAWTIRRLGKHESGQDLRIYLLKKPVIEEKVDNG